MHTRKATVHGISLGVLLAVGPSIAAAGFIRAYWVDDLLGWWNDSSNWSETAGGPGGGPVPTTDFFAQIDNTDDTSNLIVLYTEPPGAGTLNSLVISGTGTGATGLVEFIMGTGSGVLSTEWLDVRSHVSFAQNGGTVIADFMELRGGGQGVAGPTYTLTGGADLQVALQLDTCSSGNPVEFMQDGGTSTINRVWLGDCETDYRSYMTLEDGIMTVSSLDIAVRSPATFDLNGGTLNVNRIDLGWWANGGEFVQRGGHLQCTHFDAYKQWGDNHTMTFAGGTADITNVDVSGVGTNPDVIYLTGGHVTVENDLELGGTSELLVISGTLDVGRTIGNSFFTEANAGMQVSGGVVTADEATLDGEVLLSGGVVDVNYYRSDGHYTAMLPGSELVIRDSGNIDFFDVSGGLLHGGFLGPPFNLYLLADVNADVFSYSGGDIYSSIACADLVVTTDLTVGGTLKCNGDMLIDPAHQISARDWEILGDLSLAGGTIVSNFGDVDLTWPGASLIGPGTVNGDVVSEGTVSAGTNGLGTIRINGDLNCEPGGSVQTTLITNPPFTFVPRVDVTGNADLEGTTLRVSVSNTTWNPSIGYQVTVLTAADVIGTFDFVNFDQSGLVPYDFKAVYSTPGRVMLQVVEPICFGDANGDDAVNFADLELLLENWDTEVEPGNNGDVTFNGTVDFADLNILLENWGMICD